MGAVEPPVYPKGDLRRMLSVLAAIATLDDATQLRIAARTGLDKRTVLTLIQMARTQAGVTISKDGPIYRLTDWGPVISPIGAAMALGGGLGSIRSPFDYAESDEGGLKMRLRAIAEWFYRKFDKTSAEGAGEMSEEGSKEMSDKEFLAHVKKNISPLTHREGEVYNFENREFYDVSRIIADILRDESQFKFGTIGIERLWPQVQGSGGIDPAHIERIPVARISEPVILITYENGSARLVDGYHRLAKARSMRAELIAAYILTWEQTQKYLLDPKKIPKYMRMP